MRILLRTERLKRNMSLNDVAKLIGYTKSAYGNLELGRKNASPKVWDRLEDLFHVDQRELRKIQSA